MSTGATVMMALTIALVWGGLVAAVIQLRRHPDRPEHPPESAASDGSSDAD